MKRVTAIILAILMILGMAACGAKQEAPESAPDDGGVRSDLREALEDAHQPEEEPVPEEDEPVEDAETADEPEAEAEEPEDDVELVFGEVSGNTYENRTLGIGVTLDESWTFASKEEILEMNGSFAEELDDETLREIMETSANLMDMYADTEEGLVNISVSIEDLGAIYGTLLDEEGYLNVALENLDDAMAGMTMFTDYSYEQGTIEFAGAERTALRIHEVVYDTVDAYQTEVLVKAGRYMAVITLTSFEEDRTDEMAGYFYALD